MFNIFCIPGNKDWEQTAQHRKWRKADKQIREQTPSSNNWTVDIANLPKNTRL